MKKTWIHPLGLALSASLFFIPFGAGAVVQTGTPVIVTSADEPPDTTSNAPVLEKTDSPDIEESHSADITTDIISAGTDGKQDKATQTEDAGNGGVQARDSDVKPPEADSTDDNGDEEFKVNINTAEADELVESLKGIGPSKAKEIIKYREKHGPFKRIDHLKKVKGIGPSTYENIKSQVEL